MAVNGLKHEELPLEIGRYVPSAVENRNRSKRVVEKIHEIIFLKVYIFFTKSFYNGKSDKIKIFGNKKMIGSKPTLKRKLIH